MPRQPFKLGDEVYVIYRNPHAANVAHIKEAEVVDHPLHEGELALFMYDTYHAFAEDDAVFLHMKRRNGFTVNYLTGYEDITGISHPLNAKSNGNMQRMCLFPMVKPFVPQLVYIEPRALEYPLGKELRDKFSNMGLEIRETTSHNQVRNIPGKATCKNTEMRNPLW